MTTLVRSVVGQVLDALSVPEARRLTDEVKQDARSLWRKLADLHERGAHIALGYETWQDYCTAEFALPRMMAQRFLDSGRVAAIVESRAQDRAREEIPNAAVAGELAKLLPPTNSKSVSRGRNGSEEKVAEAWQAVLDESNGEPITAPKVKQILVKRGYLPDTSGNAGGKPGWFELLGEVGDTLIRADKQLAKVEGELRRKPNKAFRNKAGEYAAWAEELAERLRRIETAA